MARNKPLLSEPGKAVVGSALGGPSGRSQRAATPGHKTIILSQQKADSDAQWRRAGLPRLLSIKALAAGLDVSEKTVHRWIANGSLPHHRIGRQIRITEHDLHAFLAGGRRG